MKSYSRIYYYANVLVDGWLVGSDDGCVEGWLVGFNEIDLLIIVAQKINHTESVLKNGRRILNIRHLIIYTVVVGKNMKLLEKYALFNASTV